MVINHLAKAIKKDSYFCQKCRKKHDRSSLGLFYAHRKYARKHKSIKNKIPEVAIYEDCMQ